MSIVMNKVGPDSVLGECMQQRCVLCGQSAQYPRFACDECIAKSKAKAAIDKQRDNDAAVDKLFEGQPRVAWEAFVLRELTPNPQYYWLDRMDLMFYRKQGQWMNEEQK